VLGFRLFGVDPSHPYVVNRGITLATARHFGIGYYFGRGIMSHRIVVPIPSRSGNLVAYAGRSIDGAQPKYRLPPGFRKAGELFNVRRAAQSPAHGRVFLVEGFFDCMKVHQAGYPNVVALMGCSLSDIQAHLLAEHFREVVLLLDGDEAGNVASNKIATRLSGNLRIHRGRIPPNRQPDELTCSELQAVIEDAVT
jgi:DNA primase